MDSPRIMWGCGGGRAVCSAGKLPGPGSPRGSPFPWSDRISTRSPSVGLAGFVLARRYQKADHLSSPKKRARWHRNGPGAFLCASHVDRHTSRITLPRHTFPDQIQESDFRRPGGFGAGVGFRPGFGVGPNGGVMPLGRLAGFFFEVGMASLAPCAPTLRSVLPIAGQSRRRIPAAVQSSSTGVR